MSAGQEPSWMHADLNQGRLRCTTAACPFDLPDVPIFTREDLVTLSGQLLCLQLPCFGQRAGQALTDTTALGLLRLVQDPCWQRSQHLDSCPSCYSTTPGLTAPAALSCPSCQPPPMDKTGAEKHESPLGYKRNALQHRHASLLLT